MLKTDNEQFTLTTKTKAQQYSQDWRPWPQ